MRRLWNALRELPLVVRAVLLGAAGVIVAMLVSAGVWSLVHARQSAAREAFSTAAGSYRPAMQSREETQLAAAATGLRQYLRDYPRSDASAQGWYLLGNLESDRRAFDAALAAYQEAARGDTGTVGGLSRLATGHAWEAKGDAARALEAYRVALEGRKPGDFLYGELLLAMARVQEQLGQAAAAIEAYRRLLREVPDFGRAEDARSRLAILGAGVGG